MNIKYFKVLFLGSLLFVAQRSYSMAAQTSKALRTGSKQLTRAYTLKQAQEITNQALRNPTTSIKQLFKTQDRLNYALTQSVEKDVLSGGISEKTRELDKLLERVIDATEQSIQQRSQARRWALMAAAATGTAAYLGKKHGLQEENPTKTDIFDNLSDID
jgi:hypothetical protein